MYGKNRASEKLWKTRAVEGTARVLRRITNNKDNDYHRRPKRPRNAHFWIHGRRSNSKLQHTNRTSRGVWALHCWTWSNMDLATKKEPWQTLRNDRGWHNNKLRSGADHALLGGWQQRQGKKYTNNAIHGIDQKWQQGRIRTLEAKQETQQTGISEFWESKRIFEENEREQQQRQSDGARQDKAVEYAPSFTQSGEETPSRRKKRSTRNQANNLHRKKSPKQ